jgi:hypothetical protein
MADVMRSVLVSSNSILFTPEPTVLATKLDGGAVELALSFRVVDLAAAGKAKSEVLDLIYRHAKAAGLILARPHEGDEHTVGSVNTEEVHHHRSTPHRLLDAIALFDSLTEDEKEALAQTMTRRTFRASEIIVEQGAVLTSLMVIRSGVVSIIRRETEIETELGRLAPGHFFGEGGLLTGTGEPGTVRALTFVVVYEIAQEGLAPLMRDRPAIAEELGLILSRRSVNEKHPFEKSGDTAGMPGLVTRIRHLFDIHHDEIR